MYLKRCHYVTLLELLIVMAILSFVGGAIAIGISRATVDQRFKTEVSMIVDELKLAQDLMLVLGTDVIFNIKEKDDNTGLTYWLELETPLQDSLRRELIGKKTNIKTIREFNFNDPRFPSSKGMIEIRFLFKGMMMSQGIIRVSTSSKQSYLQDSLEMFIPLAGYPRPIQAVDDEEAAEKLLKSFDDPLFDRSFTNDTFSKLPEKKKKEDQKNENPGLKNPVDNKTKANLASYNSFRIFI